jgi:hypothetical protein
VCFTESKANRSTSNYRVCDTYCIPSQVHAATVVRPFASDDTAIWLHVCSVVLCDDISVEATEMLCAKLREDSACHTLVEELSWNTL